VQEPLQVEVRMALPPGVTNGQLLRANNAPEIWLIENDQKRWIPDASTLTSNWSWEQVRVVGANIVDPIPRGPDVQSVINQVFADGTLLRVNEQDAIYVMQGGQRHWIPDVATFQARGYNWDAVRTISDPEMNAIPLGAPIPKVAGPIPIDTGNVPMGANHYVRTFGSLGRDGTLRAKTTTATNTLFGGWTHGYWVVIGDGQGRTIAATPEQSTGVDGTAIPGGGIRTVDWEFNFGADVGANAASATVVDKWQPRVDLGQMIQRAIDAAELIIELVASIEADGGSAETSNA
jgi:hypothetical protein